MPEFIAKHAKIRNTTYVLTCCLWQNTLGTRWCWAC